jgi:hypothetical protein
MWLILAENAPKPVIGWLMLSLVALLVGGLLLAWLIGRLFGPHGNWGKPLVDRRNPDQAEPPVDAWSESAKRMRVERDDEDATS